MTTTTLMLFFFILATYFHTSLALECWESCSDTSKYNPNSTYSTNLDNLLSTLTRQASTTGFNSSTIGLNEDQILAYFLCRADVNPTDCGSCVNEARSNMSTACPSRLTAFIWCESCMIGYSNAPISEDGPSYMLTNPMSIPGNSNRTFDNNIKSLVAQVVNSEIKYGTEGPSVIGNKRMYSLGQCTPDMSQDECKRCMKDAIALLPSYVIGGRVFLPRCNIRFESNKFYKDGINTAFFLPNSTNNSTVITTTTTGNKKRSYTHIIVAVLTVLGVLLLCGAAYLIYIQKRRRHHPGLEEITAKESLQFDFRTIREATNNFSVDNKLGQGGFGSVYKGRLQNGQEIAVKRLSIDSGQGIEEFKTEVLLLAKLQHKNLVRLLGFCLHSEEKLLIYELLNASLDKGLVGSSYHTTLEWDTRYKILVGVARGILYLHEDSRLKIIYRDLKPSNILLDQRMNPKIADFGLARLVGTDQVQAVTSNVMGTFGYMPPEYTRTGRFSNKTDVYSFGIIILEMLSGHKCNSTTFPYEEESLPQRAWRLWKEGTTFDLVDARLNGNFTGEEVTRCIHIGLLCIQEDPNKRPTMAPIVSALNGHLVAFSEPEPPQETVPTGYYSSGQSSILTNTTESDQSRDHKSSTEVSKNMDDITDLYPR